MLIWSFQVPTFAFCDSLSFEEDLALYLHKLESLYLRMICTKLEFLDKIFLFTVYYPPPLLFCNYLPLSSFAPNWISSPYKDDLCRILLKLAQWFWRRSQKYKKNRRTDRQTTHTGRSEKLTWAKKMFTSSFHSKSSISCHGRGRASEVSSVDVSLQTFRKTYTLCENKIIISL
jgi:hypothetical protein